MRDDFERDFESISVEAVVSMKGLISCQIGKPTKWNPNKYALTTYWKNEAALINFAGDKWYKALIPEGMEDYPTSYSVEHFHIADIST